MNFNPDLFHATWTATIIAWTITMPILVALLIWFGATVDSFVSLAMTTHNVGADTPVTLRTVLLGGIVIPFEVLVMQVVSLIIFVCNLEYAYAEYRRR
jgi:hypothetical protein